MQAMLNDCRCHVRYPVHLAARVLSGAVESPNCVIENFSLTGMAVLMPGTDAALQPEVGGLRYNALVTITFNLPIDGRQMQARALLKYMHREGEAVRIGLSFMQPQPTIMDSLLQECLD